MRLKFREFEELAKRKGFRTGNEYLRKLGGDKSTMACLKAGRQIGYDLVKDIYNEIGEYQTAQVIDFEEETISGLKAKYIQVGSKLY